MRPITIRCRVAAVVEEEVARRVLVERARCRAQDSKWILRFAGIRHAQFVKR